ncbi:MAG: cupin domain-containing protein [Kiloniellales bacterium]|nr:cupin domain-containing protein [Kiloniellales bacterium]
MSIQGATGVREASLPWVDIGVRPGYNQRYKGFFDKQRQISARIGSLYAEPYYHSPRHRHTFQQVRYVLSGKMKYGSEVYERGDCLYIPEGAYYGPIKPVESGEQLHFADIQFEGPSGIPYPDPDEVVAAQRNLAETGTFDEGVYTFANGRKRDAYEAILEQITGERIEYPVPRLSSYVVLRTPGIPWHVHPSLKGVQSKDLAYFFETGPNIKMASVERGRVLPAATPVGHRAVFLLEGDLRFDGETFDSLSYFMLPCGEEHGPLEAMSDATLLMIGWSSQGERVPLELF